MILIYITFPNKKEAKKIGRALIKERLADCINIFPIDSIYHWQGKITEDKEMVLIVKTFEKNFSEIEKIVKKLHSYKIPCIFSISAERVSRDYLGWIKKEIK